VIGGGRRRGDLPGGVDVTVTLDRGTYERLLTAGMRFRLTPEQAVAEAIRAWLLKQEKHKS
jgi:hypothetical protein